MFLSKSNVGICNKIRFLLLPFVVLTSQVPFNFEKIILEKIIQNVSSLSSFTLSIVSFETRNLCTFLLGLFRSIISSLVNDYYLISFLFQSVSFKHMYQILYFIFHRYKLLSTPPIFFCYSRMIRCRRFIYNH